MRAEAGAQLPPLPRGRNHGTPEPLIDSELEQGALRRRIPEPEPAVGAVVVGRGGKQPVIADIPEVAELGKVLSEIVALLLVERVEAPVLGQRVGIDCQKGELRLLAPREAGELQLGVGSLPAAVQKERAVLTPRVFAVAVRAGI